MAEDIVYKLYVGSVKPTEFYFYDSEDNEQPLVGATAAVLNIKDSSGSTTKLLELTSAETPGLVIDLNSNKITATLSQAEADALVPGRYIADIALQFASGWQHTAPFEVEISRGISEHI